MRRLRSVQRLSDIVRCSAVLLVVGSGTPGAKLVGGEMEPVDAKRVVLRGIPYVARGRTHLQADVFLPEGAGPFPGVLMVHGGGWVSGYREQMNQHSRILAEKGFVVVSISYRLAPRFHFPAQLVDCQDALRWMVGNAERYHIDSTRLAGFGYSAGAQLVCLLGFDSGPSGQPGAADQTCPRLRAVVAGGTPCDLTAGTYGGLLRCAYLGGTRRQYPERYRQASPLYHLSACCPPTFFYHGDVDRMVGAEGVRAASRRLRELGVRSEVYWVTGKGHVATFADDAAIRRAAAFLTDVLGPAAELAPADNAEHH